MIIDVKEISWVITNSILDSSDEELGTMTVSQLVKIRDIIEEEIKAYLSDRNKKTINEIINNV